MKYEMLMLLRTDMEEDAREAEIKKYADVVTSMGGSVDAIDKWGVRKTGYPIRYQTEAFFFLMTFTANGACVKELDRLAGISSDVLRRMITKKEV